MRKRVRKTNTGHAITYILTPEEKEQAKKELFESLERLYRRKAKKMGWPI